MDRAAHHLVGVSYPGRYFEMGEAAREGRSFVDCYIDFDAPCERTAIGAGTGGLSRSGGLR